MHVIGDVMANRYTDHLINVFRHFRSRIDAVFEADDDFIEYNFAICM